MESYSLTLDEACQFLKISRPTATNWIRTGRLQATRKDTASLHCGASVSAAYCPGERG